MADLDYQHSLSTIRSETDAGQHEENVEELPAAAGEESSRSIVAIGGPPVQSIKKVVETPAIDSKNWLIHLHFVRNEFETCKSLTKEQLNATNGSCEYAVYIEGLIKRQEGKIQESLELFQTCSLLNPPSVDNLKQIARSLFLQARHKAAIDVYKEAEKCSPHDWEIAHNAGICYMYLKEFEKAKENLKKAVGFGRSEASFHALGKVFLLENQVDGAIDVYTAAIHAAPESGTLLTSLGLLLMQTGQYQKAFDHLGNALTFDPTNIKAIMAAACMMQTHGDFDVALSKYRIAAVSTPESAPLWNNIGMCFYGKKKMIAAVSCLKRASYLAPFDWKILHNLGLVHLSLQQYASAFHFLSAAINLRPKNAQLYHLLAMTLKYLEDVDNCCRAYEKACLLDTRDPAIPLNFSLFLYEQRRNKEAITQFQDFQSRYKSLKQAAPSEVDAELVTLANKLGPALQGTQGRKAKVEVHSSTTPRQEDQNKPIKNQDMGAISSTSLSRQDHHNHKVSVMPEKSEATSNSAAPAGQPPMQHGYGRPINVEPKVYQGPVRFPESHTEPPRSPPPPYEE